MCAVTLPQKSQPFRLEIDSKTNVILWDSKVLEYSMSAIIEARVNFDTIAEQTTTREFAKQVVLEGGKGVSVRSTSPAFAISLPTGAPANFSRQLT